MDEERIQTAEKSIRLQEPPFALPFDTILNGRYRVGRVLGFGGFGITYQGYDLRSESYIAIKEFFPSGVAMRPPGTTEVRINAHSDQFYSGKEKFLQEARIIYHCRSNEHMLHIYSLFEEYGTAYYVMEFLEGQDLMHYLKAHGGKLTWDELFPIMEQVMDALILVHKEGIIHRDISPENIYLCPDNHAKLIDFGTARSVRGDQSRSIILKKGYAPPEQYSSYGAQGEWTDIYALGATMYRALTGKVPVESIERQSSVRNQRGDPLLRPSLAGASIPKPVEDAIMYALALEEKKRFRSVEAFYNAVRSCAHTQYSGTATVNQRVRSVFESIRGTLQAWAMQHPVLIGVTGIYEGREFRVESDIIFGRDPKTCNVVFPPNTHGVSRTQCQIMVTENGKRVLIIDCGSTNGTFLNGIRLFPGQPAILQAGCTISFGGNHSFYYTLK